MATQNYTFALDSFTVHNTRARHLDTDYVSISLAIAGQQPITQTRAMGDLNNGTYKTGLAFENIPIDDEQIVVFSYSIINNGHSPPNQIEKALGQAAYALADKAAKAAAEVATTAIGAALGASIGTGVVPIIGTALGALAGWLVSETGTILFANCDGPVAAGVHPLFGRQIRAGTNNGGTVHAVDNNPGTNSPVGCGSNSNYDVSWSVMSVDGAAEALQAGWRWCRKCQGLFFAEAGSAGAVPGAPPSGSAGACPAGGQHTQTAAGPTSSIPYRGTAGRRAGGGVASAKGSSMPRQDP